MICVTCGQEISALVKVYGVKYRVVSRTRQIDDIPGVKPILVVTVQRKEVERARYRRVGTIERARSAGGL